MRAGTIKKITNKKTRPLGRGGLKRLLPCIGFINETTPPLSLNYKPNSELILARVFGPTIP